MTVSTGGGSDGGLFRRTESMKLFLTFVVSVAVNAMVCVPAARAKDGVA